MSQFILTKWYNRVRAAIGGGLIGQATNNDEDGAAQRVEAGGANPIAGAAWVKAVLGSVFTPEPWQTDEDSIPVDLGTARLSPGVEILDLEGSSLEGRALTIQALGGDAIIRLLGPGQAVSTALTGLTDTHYGTVAFDMATKKITRTLGNWSALGSSLDYSRPGTRIAVAGTAGGLNAGPFTVVGLGVNPQELVVVEALVNEVASATETFAGFYPKRAPTWTKLSYPNMVALTTDRRFTKVYVENVAQVGVSMTLVVGKE